MKRFRSITDCSESIGIKSPKAVKRLGTDIRAFYRSQPPKDGCRQTLRPLAQAFIDREGGSHFSAVQGVSQEEILESVVRLLQIQHRNDTDNKRRLMQRTGRGRGRRMPPGHLMEEEDGSFTDDLIEVTGKSSNPQVTPSEGSEQDETYLPSRDSPFLEAKENRNTRLTRHRTSHAIVVGSSGVASDTYGHEQMQHERADERPRSPVSMTAASSQATQENDNTSGVADTVIFNGFGRPWYFKSVEQKAQVLEAVANGVAIASTDDIAEMEKRQDEEADEVDLFYLVFLFPEFRTTLYENGAQPRQGDISHPSNMIYRGESLHFNSVEEKAQALEAGMVKLEEKVDWYFDEVKRKCDQIIYRRLSSYYKRKYVPRIKDLLLANGAGMCRPSHIAHS